MHVERVKGQKRKALEEMINEPVILQFLGGEIYGGMVDECEDGVVYLYDCKRLSPAGKKWVSHGSWHLHNGKRIEDDDVGLTINLIENIFVVKSEYYDNLSIDDTLQFYIDPHHKPFLKGVECRESSKEDHSLECDRRLHDALTVIYDCGWEGSGKEQEAYEKFQEAFRYIRIRLIMYGAKIP